MAQELFSKTDSIAITIEGIHRSLQRQTTYTDNPPSPGEFPFTPALTANTLHRIHPIGPEPQCDLCLPELYLGCLLGEKNSTPNPRPLVLKRCEDTATCDHIIKNLKYKWDVTHKHTLFQDLKETFGDGQS